MAKLSSDKKYVTVEKGDTLSEIARDYKQYSGNASYQQLATWNKISNPNLIYIGQKIYLSKNGASSSGSSSSSSKKSTSNSNKVTIKHFGLQSNVDNVLFVDWDWSKSNTESYLVEWTYFTRDGVWFVGNSTTNTVDSNNPAAARQSTYSIPSNAVKTRVRIKPISKKKKVNNKETNYWTASWCEYKYHSDYSILTTPSAPNVEIEKFKLTATLENIDIPNATTIEFQIYKNDSNTVYKAGKANITATKTASWSYTVGSGAEYKVRCRAKSSVYSSDWGPFSSGIECKVPKAPSGITTLKALSETSVFVDWECVTKVETYKLEYTEKKMYFDSSSSNVRSVTIDAKITDHAEITGLTSGTEYFFRLRCENEGDGNVSAWTPIKSIVLGKEPSAPTTWSSTTTAIVGEKVYLYWVHNSQDNSSETYAQMKLVINGKELSSPIKIKNTTNEDDKDLTSSVTIDTTKNTISWVEDTGTKTQNLEVKLAEGATIQWCVRTAGITEKYGAWSVQRSIDLYAPPELEIYVTDKNGNPVEVMESFPIYVRGVPGPETQTPISYYVSVIANESYETVDNVGNTKLVNKGEEIYSEHYDISTTLRLELTPSSIDLENNVSYTLYCTVSMNSGLTAEADADFSVSWTDEMYVPNAEISYDPETYVTHINPYCTNTSAEYRVVTRNGDIYNVGEEIIADDNLDGIFTETGELVCVGRFPSGSNQYYCVVYTDEDGNDIKPVYHMVRHDTSDGQNIFVKLDTTVSNENRIEAQFTTTGEIVERKMTSDGRDIYCCLVETIDYVDDVTLSVYRREYDGRFVEISTGIDNKRHTYVTDPHPALDYARYRIVAISNTTGAVSFYDVPGHPINEVGAIIQWDEEWSTFDTTEESELEQPPWTGSLIRLPYNIDVSDSSAPDSANVEYIGRSHPVSYYGTQLGITSSWNMEIPKDYKDTLNALRRLMIHMGDVYVREPSGSGYWANVNVSFSQTHCETTIPVSLEITRVEGGA